MGGLEEVEGVTGRKWGQRKSSQDVKKWQEKRKKENIFLLNNPDICKR